MSAFRLSCHHCGVTTWMKDYREFMLDHDRPDGRKCRRARKTITCTELNALPGQGELPTNLERDLRETLNECSICRRQHGREIVHACE